MHLKAIVILVIALAAGCRSVEPAIVIPVADERAAEERRLAMAGFEPLGALSARGLEVQRADLMWDLLDVPSVELTRDRAGAVTVSLKFWGHERDQVVPAAIWGRMAASAPAAFRPADPAALRHRDREVVRRSGYCHTWHQLEAVIAGVEMRAWGSPCMGDLHRAPLAYVDALARIAIDYIDLCAPDRRHDEDNLALLMECGHRFGSPTAEYIRRAS